MKVTKRMNCPHCKHLIETIHIQNGYSYEYTKDKPETQGGIVAKIICPKCQKEFYNTITIGTGTRAIDDEIHKYKCPYCNKTVAFRHEYDVGMIAEISRTKPSESEHHPHLLISRRCDEPRCKKTFWIEVYYAV